VTDAGIGHDRSYDRGFTASLVLDQTDEVHRASHPHLRRNVQNISSHSIRGRLEEAWLLYIAFSVGLILSEQLVVNVGAYTQFSTGQISIRS